MEFCTVIHMQVVLMGMMTDRPHTVEIETQQRAEQKPLQIKQITVKEIRVFLLLNYILFGLCTVFFDIFLT